jgi:hypothetical protein
VVNSATKKARPAFGVHIFPGKPAQAVIDLELGALLGEGPWLGSCRQPMNAKKVGSAFTPDRFKQSLAILFRN